MHGDDIEGRRAAQCPRATTASATKPLSGSRRYDWNSFRRFAVLDSSAISVRISSLSARTTLSSVDRMRKKRMKGLNISGRSCAHLAIAARTVGAAWGDMRMASIIARATPIHSDSGAAWYISDAAAITTPGLLLWRMRRAHRMSSTWSSCIGSARSASAAAGSVSAPSGPTASAPCGGSVAAAGPPPSSEPAGEPPAAAAAAAAAAGASSSSSSE